MSSKLKVQAKLKSKVDWLAVGLLRLGVSPNIVTAVGLILSFAAAYLYYIATSTTIWAYYSGATLLSLSGLCDAVDGTMARLSNRVTSFGSYLDSVLDRYSDSVVIMGITLGAAHVVILGVDVLVWGFLALVGSLLVSYSRAKAESLGTKLEGVGIAERAERVAIIIVTSVILRPELGLFLIAIVANLTVIQRGIHTYRKLKAGVSKAER
ncbi:MAG: CDP-alcohol phosphatidyltransferase family protein [Candidatus Bathyarchaeia archaeon]